MESITNALVKYPREIIILVLIGLIFLLSLEGKENPKDNPSPEDGGITYVDSTVYNIKDTVIYDTVFKDTIIYNPRYITETPTPNAPPSVKGVYIDTLNINDCMIFYNITTHGVLESLQIGAKSKRKITTINTTTYKTKYVDKKIYPSSLYLGGGIGGNKEIIDDIGPSMLYVRPKYAYTAGYDFIDETFKVSMYIKIL